MREYLAIKNWAKYQSLRGGGEWIKDYTNQDDDDDLKKLTFFQRGVLQALRRVRGRTGRNICNDHEDIACATQARLKDRPRLPQAIRELTALGLLIVTNQQFDSDEAGESKREKESKKEIEKEQNLPARSASLEFDLNEPDLEYEAKPEPPRKQPKPPKPKPDSVFEKAYLAYPRHVGGRAAEVAWGKAVNREAAKHPASFEQHEDFIFQRVMQYAAACRFANKPREYIPHMATWLNQDRFLDDPSEWAAEGSNGPSGNGGNGGSVAQISKAEQREAARDAKWAAFLAGRSASGELPEGGGIGLLSGDQRAPNGAVDESSPARIFPRGNH